MKTRPIKTKDLEIDGYYLHRNTAWARHIIGTTIFETRSGSEDKIVYEDVHANGRVLGPSFCNVQTFIRVCPTEIVMKDINKEAVVAELKRMHPYLA